MSGLVTAAPSPAMILALAAELIEGAIKDKTYRQTPIGHAVGRYLDELAFENYSPKTIESRENSLAWLALDLAHVELADVTTDDLRGFLARRWGHAAPNTRAAHVSTVRVFFAWAHLHDLIAHDPAGKRIRAPRVGETDRRAHDLAVIRKLVVSQDARRDRVALLLMYWEGLRRNELRLTQVKHLDLANRSHTVYGKGGTVIPQNIPEPVALELERLILDSQAEPDHYLLHPMRWVRRGTWPDYDDDVVSADPARPLTPSGIDKWWKRMLANAGLEHFPMHELRHSAGTHFYKTDRDLLATQHFMRHKSPATTARVYVHLDRMEAVRDVQRRMPDPMSEADS